MNYQELKTALKTLQDQGHEIPALNSKKEILETALAQILATTAPEIVEVSIEPTAPRTGTLQAIQQLDAMEAIASNHELVISVCQSVKYDGSIDIDKATGIIFDELCLDNGMEWAVIAKCQEAIKAVYLSSTPSPEPTAPSTVTNYDTTPSVEIPSPEVTPAFTNPEHPALTEVREIAKGLEIVIIWAIAVLRSLIRFATPHIKTALLAALRFTIYTIALLGYWLLPKAQLVIYTLGFWGMTIALKIIRNDRGWSIA